jgi:hypothetical protein
MATAAATHTNLSPARQPLLWIVPLTLAWTLLITWQPAITASSVPATAARLTVHGLIALGLWLTLERTDLGFEQRRNMWLWIMVPLTLWLAVAWSGSVKGVFSAASDVPLLPIAILGPVIIGAPILLLSKRIGQLLDAMPAGWLVGLQAYRVFGAAFLAGALRGTLPGLFGYPAGIGDALTGMFALPVAIAVATGTAEGRTVAIFWNLFGLADLAVAITIGMITSSGPLQLVVTSSPSIGSAGYPSVLTPAFAVPSSILLHLLSLRLLARRKARSFLLEGRDGVLPADFEAAS